jgi:ubiquinone/menaquinone biosynthesis C-methylase UbiE
LVAAAEVRLGYQVLDVATGSGEAALIAKFTVGELVGSDISRTMLKVARSRLVGGALLPVVADGQALPFRDACFDAILCQLGLMFFPDPTRGLAEARRVLRSGRCAAVCVISSPEKAPMWGVLAKTLCRYLPDRAKELQLSFELADAGRLLGMFKAAGFRDVRVTRETREGVYESFEEYWAPIESGAGLMPQAYLSLPKATRKEVRDEVRERLLKFKSNGRIAMSLEMLIGTGRA